MNRLIRVIGVLAAAIGIGCLLPAIIDWKTRGNISPLGMMIIAVGASLVLSGIMVIWRGLRSPRQAYVPAPVRAVIAACILFLSFCALETSDGLLRQGGRVLYWTTILFLPALCLLYGLASARPWAWWLARTGTGLSTLWFLGFVAIIPFADLRASGRPVPFWGRMYMAGVSLVFAAISAYAFQLLGRSESRTYFGFAQKP